MSGAPLFYSQALNVAQLMQYALGVFEPPAVDVVEFGEQDGGVVERELAVPFLRGMDSVVVESARLQLRSKPREMESEFEASEAAEPGVVVNTGLTTPAGAGGLVLLTYAKPDGRVSVNAMP